MPRKPIIETEDMITCADKYIAEILEGNVGQFKIPQFGNYLRQNGINVADYIIRRNQKLKDHLNKLKSMDKESHYKKIAVYHGMDVDAFLSKYRSRETLKTALQQKDSYYHEISESAAYCFKEYKKTSEENNRLVEENRLLKEENEKQKTDNTELNKKYQIFSKEVRILRNIINTYVYPEIANELLKQNGLLKETAEMVDVDAIKHNTLKATDDVSQFASAAVNDLMKGLDE